MKVFKYISRLLLVYIGAAAALGQMAPRLSLQIGDGKQAAISNLDTITVEISANVPQVDLSNAAIVTESRNAQNLELRINMIEVHGSKRVEVPTIRVAKIGSGIHLKQSYVSLAIEIPVDAAVRDAEIAAFLERAKKTADSGKDPHMKKLYGDPHTAAFLSNQLKGLYHENRTGDFELECKLISREGAWKGSVECPPAKFKVIFKQHFFDQKQFLHDQEPRNR